MLLCYYESYGSWCGCLSPLQSLQIDGAAEGRCEHGVTKQETDGGKVAHVAQFTRAEGVALGF